ncbi:MAG: hypothetical protein ACO3NZ_03235 [Pirellulales bacterium]
MPSASTVDHLLVDTGLREESLQDSRGRSRDAVGSMNFFHWLREGVRQAVVVGIADACDAIGQQAKGEDFGPALAASLRERVAAESPQPALATAGRTIDASPAGGPRRRLGRSLSQPEEALKKVA